MTNGTMTPEEARNRLRTALTDEVMKAERVRILSAIHKRSNDLLTALGIESALENKEVVERMRLLLEMHHIPGDHLWQAMQFFFRVAREGADEADLALVGHYSEILFRVLFAAPMRTKPVIPEDWWGTPLGVACRVVIEGIESCYDVLEQLDEGETTSDGDGHSARG